MKGLPRPEWSRSRRIGEREDPGTSQSAGGDPPLLKCSWGGRGSGGGGVVGFRNGLPGADSIFFNTVTIFRVFHSLQSLPVLSLRLFRTFL